MAFGAYLCAAGRGRGDFWMRVLSNSGKMANNRKDALIATLVKTD